jgi:hypothetical protein
VAERSFATASAESAAMLSTPALGEEKTERSSADDGEMRPPMKRKGVRCPELIPDERASTAEQRERCWIEDEMFTVSRLRMEQSSSRAGS